MAKNLTRRQAIGGIASLVLFGGGAAYYNATREYDPLFDPYPAHGQLVNPEPKQEIGRLTSDNLADIIEQSGHTPAMIKFTAKWCAPCRVLQPVYEGVASEYRPDEIRFLEYDVDDRIYFEGTPLAEFSLKPSGVPRLAVLYHKRVISVLDGGDLAKGKHALPRGAVKKEVIEGKPRLVVTEAGQVSWKLYLMKQLEREIR